LWVAAERKNFRVKNSLGFGLWLAAEGKKTSERNSLSFGLQLKAKLSKFFISRLVETAETVCNCSRRFASHFLKLLGL
jgi:hypothetical protein